MKKFFSILLTNILITSLCFSTFFICVQQKFNFILTTKAVSLTEEEIEKYSNMDLSELHQMFDAELTSRGIDTEIIDYLAEDSDCQSYINEYKEEVIEAVKSGDVAPTIDESKVQKIINNNVSKYNKEHEEKITVNTTDLTKELTSKVNQVVTTVTENNSFKSLIATIYNSRYQTYANLITLISALLLIIINHLGALKYLSIALITNGITFLATYEVIIQNFFNQLSSFLGETFTKTLNYVNHLSIAYLIIGAILAILSLIINWKRRNINESNSQQS